MSDRGGTATPVTRPDPTTGAVFHRLPSFLPDGRRFLYVIQDDETDKTGLYVGSLDSDETIRVGDIRSRATYTEPGYLLFMRRRTLMAQRFDLERLELSGDAVAVGGRVSSAINIFGQAAFSVSENGVLVYKTVPLLQFVWFDRRGRRLGPLGPPDEYSSLTLAPNDQHVAFERLDPEMHVGDIWTLDIARETVRRLTFDPGWDWMPSWSPDGAMVYYGRDFLAYRQAWDGSGDEERLEVGVAVRDPNVSGDGQHLVYSLEEDLWAWPLSDGSSSIQLTRTGFQERHGRVSPDGRWLAYSSNESGTWEIYAQPFPGQGAKHLVSTDGGTQPQWRRDGEELFYVNRQQQLTAVSVGGPNPPGFGLPSTLLEVPIIGQANRIHYAVTSDGERILITTTEAGVPTSVTVVLNWFEELKARVPVP